MQESEAWSNLLPQLALALDQTSQAMPLTAQLMPLCMTTAPCASIWLSPPLLSCEQAQEEMRGRSGAYHRGRAPELR